MLPDLNKDVHFHKGNYHTWNSRCPVQW